MTPFQLLAELTLTRKARAQRRSGRDDVLARPGAAAQGRREALLEVLALASVDASEGASSDENVIARQRPKGGITTESKIGCGRGLLFGAGSVGSATENR